VLPATAGSHSTISSSINVGGSTLINLPLAYFTESEEDAKDYADMDVLNLDLYKATAKMEYRDRIMRGKDVGGLTEEEYINKKAEESFRALHGREPNKSGRVESYSYTPKKPLDITEIGDITDAGKAYKALAEKLGMSESELDDILLLEQHLNLLK
jgi:hypothetical protein